MSTKPGADDVTPIAYIIDDDIAVRTSLVHLLRSVGLRVRDYSNTASFKADVHEDAPSCLLLDVRLRGESGLVFQQQQRKNCLIPIIFMTGYSDITTCVKAMRAGAFDFLIKPVADQEVIDLIMTALAADAQRRTGDQARAGVQDTYNRLSPREREVLAYVVGGALNKQIAAAIGISEVTVKLHRGAAMRKMQARSVPDLVRKAEAIGVQPINC